MKYIVLLGMLFFAGCTPQSEQEKIGLQQPLAKPELKYIRAKLGADVNLATRDPFAVPLATTVAVQLDLQTGAEQGSMNLDVSTSKDLVLISPTTEFSFDLNSSKTYPVILQVKALSVGRHYVNLHIQTLVDGYKSSRVLAAIIEVAGPTPNTQDVNRLLKKQTTSAEQSSSDLIILPAQETIVSP